MEDFKMNNCRLCIKVFCCINCREKHEIKEHNIFPDCDICVYGRQVWANALKSLKLLNHLKTRHWPIHCVFCKKLFATTDELLVHRKCPVGYKKENSPKGPIIGTPIRPFADEEYCSPVTAETQQNNNLDVISHYVATSTPMQRGDEPNLMLKNIQKITPVDYSQGKSIIKKSSNSIQSDQSMKRRVTFCETPITDNKEKKNLSKNNRGGIEEEDTSENIVENSGVKEYYSQNKSSGHTPSGYNSENFYSAKENMSEITGNDKKIEDNYKREEINKTNEAMFENVYINDGSNVQKKEESIANNEEKEVENESTKDANSTLWISAENTTTLEKSDEEQKDIPLSFISKLDQKKKINVVTPVIQRKDVNIMFNIPLHLASTPLVPLQQFNEIPSNIDNESPQTPPEPNEPNNILSDIHIEPSQNDSIPQNKEKHIQNEAAETYIKIEEKHTDNALMTEQTHSLWISMTKIVKSVIYSFSNTDISSISKVSSRSLKRSFAEHEPSESTEGPCVKRYKLTDIKCRPTIRPLPALMYPQRLPSLELLATQSLQISTGKIFVDKATQTDF